MFEIKKLFINTFSIFCIFFLVSISYQPIIAEVSINNIIYVDDDGTADYTSIQDAIDNASDGDIIIVYEGVYYESITIDKTLHIIGEDKNNTIIDASNKSKGVKVRANDTLLTQFTIRNASKQNSYGVELFYHQDFKINNVTIYNNNIIDCTTGFYVYSIRNDIEIAFNNIKNCSVGIRCTNALRLYAHDNYIEGKNKSNGYGFITYLTDLCIIENNIIKNFEFGIYLYDFSSLNIFKNNHITNNTNGTYIRLSRANSFEKNNFIGNNLNANFLGNIHWFISMGRGKSIWRDNYWDDLVDRNIKVIKGKIAYTFLFLPYLEFGFYLPSYDFDWTPAKEPYDIHSIE